ncbi:MAG: hypothetical protein LM582_04325 [Desulfurococcaceae archaeon]|nr:hypothetical protein [Desulfurococcaceae archaeon]
MSTYEKYVEELLKLQRCYRVQNILQKDVISKIDLIAKPSIALTLALTLWSVAKIRQGVLSYSDVVYLQKRLANFLIGRGKNDVEVLKKLFDLIPMRYGMSIPLAARRCNVSEEILSNTMKALNMLREVVDMVSIGVQLNEPLKHNPSTCLNDVDMLPPTASNSREYLMLMITSLKANIEKIPDPLLRQIATLIYEEINSVDNLRPDDVAAIALIIKILTENLRSSTLCAEPSINIAALSQKLLNDLASLGVDPSNSPFYRLYQEISTRGLMHNVEK